VGTTAKERYDQYLWSSDWRSLRERILARDYRKCMRCKAYGTTANPLNVHHFTYERLGNEWNSDLGTFCQRCHLRVHGNKYHYYQEKTRYWEIAKIRSRVHWDKPVRRSGVTSSRPVGMASGVSMTWTRTRLYSWSNPQRRRLTLRRG
jgi:5-methylcytosine-specific restriction endonuclease McrA